MTHINTIECIKALSRIEGYTMSYEGMKRSHPLYDAIDLIMQHLQTELLSNTPTLQKEVMEMSY